MTEEEPQVFSSGHSTKTNLVEALQEAVQQAMMGIPTSSSNQNNIDLALVSVSSLYDSNNAATVVVSTLCETVQQMYGKHIQHLIGSSVAGCIGGTTTTTTTSSTNARSSLDISTSSSTAVPVVVPIESESVPSVTVTLALLPDTRIHTFHVPDGTDLSHPRTLEEWNRSVLSMSSQQQQQDNNNNSKEEPVIFLLPSPGFATKLNDMIQGFANFYPRAKLFGGVASTVSSLSRAKLYTYSRSNGAVVATDGCAGLFMEGDFRIRTLMATGAKPVGGIYRIVKGQDSTISVVVLDDVATEALREEEEWDDEEEEEEDEPRNAREAAAMAYQKAQIPKPPLAEANFILKTLSDDDQAFMRRQLLIGVEQGGSVGQSASDLARLAEGRGHRFQVHAVASAGMKDGSVTFPLESVEISVGTRIRFFVRDPNFAKREIEALWIGFKKRQLEDQFDDNKTPFVPTGVFMCPTLDRGSKFFNGKIGYESTTLSKMMPGLPCISGFFCNGIIGQVGEKDQKRIGVQGSCTGYTLLGSVSGRPIYSARDAAIAKAKQEAEVKAAEAEAKQLAAENEKRVQRAKVIESRSQRAPRSENGELVLRRREIHAGRAMTVSAVEWSVAEKTASPTSVLEGYMWDKETEVDRFRERIPLANLVSQCRLSTVDPASPKPRNFLENVRLAASSGKFVVIPECKRLEPSTGSLRKRYDIEKLSSDFTKQGVAAISVNCDAVLFGGSMDDIGTAREASGKAAIQMTSVGENDDDGVVAPCILASDLLLYPYQLYKLRLAGADAVTLVVGALAPKDLLYLMKIAKSLQIQTLLSVTTEVQLGSLVDVDPGTFSAIVVSNRNLEDFAVDESGEQALKLLQSEAMQSVRAKHPPGLPVFVEGRVGSIEKNGSSEEYIRALQDAGATGAIIGAAIAEGSFPLSEGRSS